MNFSNIFSPRNRAAVPQVETAGGPGLLQRLRNRLHMPGLAQASREKAADHVAKNPRGRPVAIAVPVDFSPSEPRTRPHANDEAYRAGSSSLQPANYDDASHHDARLPESTRAQKVVSPVTPSLSPSAPSALTMPEEAMTSSPLSEAVLEMRRTIATTTTITPIHSSDDLDKACLRNNRYLGLRLYDSYQQHGTAPPGRVQSEIAGALGEAINFKRFDSPNSPREWDKVIARMAEDLIRKGVSAPQIKEAMACIRRADRGTSVFRVYTEAIDRLTATTTNASQVSGHGRIKHDASFMAAKKSFSNWRPPTLVAPHVDPRYARQALHAHYQRNHIDIDRRLWEQTNQHPTNPEFAKLQSTGHNRSELINSLIKFEGGIGCAENVAKISLMATALGEGFGNYLMASARTNDPSRIEVSNTHLTAFSETRRWVAEGMLADRLTPDVCAEAMRRMKAHPFFTLEAFQNEVAKIYAELPERSTAEPAHRA